MIRNLEVTKAVDHYDIAEQAGSDPAKSRVVHQAESVQATRDWLIEQGAAQADVTQAMEQIASAGRVFVEIPNGSASEGFPQR